MTSVTLERAPRTKSTRRTTLRTSTGTAVPAAVIDRQAVVDELYARHGSALLTYATRLMCDPHHAEDVVQETMLRAWNHADRLTAEYGSVSGWLTRVAHNIAIDKIRARNARPTETPNTDAPAAEAPTAGDHAGDVIDGLYVATALRSLSPAHREVLHHVYFHDRTAAETAHRLGLPVGTVKSRIHHALRRLRDALDEMTDAELGDAFR
jgi:RNA polymerase sigma-70 factor (ECF subfamily)